MFILEGFLNFPRDHTDREHREVLRSEISMNQFMNAPYTEATIYPRNKLNPIVAAYRTHFATQMYPWDKPVKETKYREKVGLAPRSTTGLIGSTPTAQKTRLGNGRVKRR